MKILLADDDMKIHLVVRMWLERNGHQTFSVHNGQEALKKFETENFDLLISDVNMPLINGVELVKEVLLRENAPELIIMLTSRCDTTALLKEVSSPRVHLLNKPFSPSTLANLIEKLSRQAAKPS